MDESCHAYKWVMVAHIIKSDAFMCATMAHFYVWHDSSISVTRLVHMTHWCVPPGPIYIRDITHPYAWHDSLIWLIHVCHHDPFLCVTWLIHKRDMTRSYDSLMCATMTHIYAWHDSSISVTRLAHMTHSCVPPWPMYMLSTYLTSMRYAFGVPTISRLLKFIGLFCKTVL